MNEPPLELPLLLIALLTFAGLGATFLLLGSVPDCLVIIGLLAASLLLIAGFTGAAEYLKEKFK